MAKTLGRAFTSSGIEAIAANGAHLYAYLMFLEARCEELTARLAEKAELFLSDAIGEAKQN